jgi:hypothetical protein
VKASLPFFQEAALTDITEYFLSESPTTISLVYFSTNSTGVLAPLNNMIAVSLGEEQPNGDVVARGFEWKGGGGAPIIGNNNSASSGGNDTTISTTETPSFPTP